MADNKILELKLVNTILKLDPSVKPVFKALSNLSIQLEEVSAQHDKEQRELEEEFEDRFRPIYEQRQKVLNGENIEIDESFFEERLKDLQDAAYDKIEVNVDDLSHLVSIVGIPDFWYKVLKNSPLVKDLMSDKDDEILQNLVSIDRFLIKGTNDF